MDRHRNRRSGHLVLDLYVLFYLQRPPRRWYWLSVVGRVSADVDLPLSELAGDVARLVETNVCHFCRIRTRRPNRFGDGMVSIAERIRGLQVMTRHLVSAMARVRSPM